MMLASGIELELPEHAREVAPSGKRLLVLSVSAGHGHIRAAEAIVACARADFPSVTVRHDDVLRLVPRWFRKIYSDLYMTLASQLPEAWGWLYRKTDMPATGTWSARLRRLFQAYCAKRLLDAIHRYQPDLIICTHFLPAEMLSDDRLKRQVGCPIWVQVTDFDLHHIWLQPAVTGYFVANEELAYRLYAQGISSARVVVSGIPLMPDFAAPPDRGAASKQLGLDPHGITVLMMGGGAGVGLQPSLVQALLAQHPDLQLIVLTGRNQALYEMLKPIEAFYAARVRIVGFTERVDQLMACADLVITKPGGLSTSECLALGLPMLLVSPIPGQEERNAAWLIQEGAALRADDPATLQYRLQRLLNDTSRLAAMRSRARALARPYAAREVLQTALALAQRET